jgi:hydrogenase assembly chaperone HypC/HupF
VSDTPHCDTGHCVTCSDEGIPMRTVERDAEAQWVCVDAAGNRQVVMTDLVEPVSPGAAVLVHAGVALALLDSEAAA